MEGTGRNQNIELLRIIAAYGIVEFHSGAPLAGIAFGGVVAFTVLANLFQVCDPTRQRSRSALATSLLVPWAFWMLVYGALNLIFRGYLLNPDLPIIYGLGIGPGGHLWFLPFIFVALITNRALVQLIGPMWLMAASLVLLLGLVASGWWVEQWQTALDPLSQYAHALPGLMIGTALGCGLASRHRRLALIATALAGLVLAYWQFAETDMAAGWQYPVAIAAVLAALLLPALPFNVEPVSRCMMGVYLVHMGMLSLCNQLTGEHQLVTVVLAFGLSLAGVWTVRRFVPVSRLVLG